MNQAKLIEAIHLETGHPRETIVEIYQAMVKEVQDAIAYGDGVRLRGFIALTPKVRKERVDKPPQAGGRTVTTPACYYAHARMSGEFNKLVDAKRQEQYPL